MSDISAGLCRIDQYRCYENYCTTCRAIKCTVCDHTYGEHYTTHDGYFVGCSECNECEGFDIRHDNS